MHSLFRKSLLDLVKGLRSHKDDESAYINQCLSEIKNEVKERDYDIKANAIEKLSYLYMIGYDISFAHFNIIEVMSQKQFSHRRTAYLCASLSFREDTDVILLSTHLFKKTFNSGQTTRDPNLVEGLQYEVGGALNCLANICTDALAQTLLEDIYGMLNSSKPYVRKKAVLVLYPIFKKFPKALRLSFDRLKNKLKDDDPGVQNAAVNVICELARKNPTNYLPLLPQLFDLLNNSNNNWMLIKLVKLLGSLIPAEPRLTSKLNEPLTHIISNTPAKSLLYECINTATMCDQMSKSMVRLCLEKLKTFVEDPDQNLKYLGLLGLNKLFKQNPKAVAQHRDLILQCLDDPDNTIRRRALELIVSMVNEKNLEGIVQKLTDHLYVTDGSYRDHVLEQIILVCKKNDYGYVRDFRWYIQLLTNMTQLGSMAKHNAELISQQLMDVTMRVPEVRDFSVEKMETLIIDNGLIGDSHNMSQNAICRVLRAAAFIVGEFNEHIEDALTLMKAMLQNRISSLPSDIQCIFIQNSLKVICSGLRDELNSDIKDNNNNSNDDDDDDNDSDENEEKTLEEIQQACKDIIDGSIRLLQPLAGSPFIEVQERATAYLYLMNWLQDQWENEENKLSDQQNLINSFLQVFDIELKPIKPKHQQIIAKKIPKDLDLDKWIGKEWSDSDDDKSDDDSDDSFGWGETTNNKNNKDRKKKISDDWFNEYDKDDGQKEKKLRETSKINRTRRVNNDPFMLGSGDSDNDIQEVSDEEEKEKQNESNISNTNDTKQNIFDNLKNFHRKDKNRKRKNKKKPRVISIQKMKGDSSDDDNNNLPTYKDPLSQNFNFNDNEEIKIPTLNAYDQNEISKKQNENFKKQQRELNKKEKKKEKKEKTKITKIKK